MGSFRKPIITQRTLLYYLINKVIFLWSWTLYTCFQNCRTLTISWTLDFRSPCSSRAVCEKAALELELRSLMWDPRLHFRCCFCWWFINSALHSKILTCCDQKQPSKKNQWNDPISYTNWPNLGNVLLNTLYIVNPINVRTYTEPFHENAHSHKRFHISRPAACNSIYITKFSQLQG